MRDFLLLSCSLACVRKYKWRDFPKDSTMVKMNKNENLCLPRSPFNACSRDQTVLCHRKLTHSKNQSTQPTPVGASNPTRDRVEHKLTTTEEGIVRYKLEDRT